MASSCYQLAFTAGAFLMLAAGIIVLGLLRRSDVATIDAEEAVTAQVELPTAKYQQAGGQTL